MERNQGGKYCGADSSSLSATRVELGRVFSASSFDRAMKKLEEAWIFCSGTKKSCGSGAWTGGGLGFSAEFLKEAGLKLDRRQEFSAKSRQCLGTAGTRGSRVRAGADASGLAETIRRASRYGRGRLTAFVNGSEPPLTPNIAIQPRMLFFLTDEALHFSFSTCIAI